MLAAAGPLAFYTCCSPLSEVLFQATFFSIWVSPQMLPLQRFCPWSSSLKCFLSTTLVVFSFYSLLFNILVTHSCVYVTPFPPNAITTPCRIILSCVDSPWIFVEWKHGFHAQKQVVYTFVTSMAKLHCHCVMDVVKRIRSNHQYRSSLKTLW